MRIIKMIGFILLALFIGGLAFQAVGYIDSPFFGWFTTVQPFK